MDNKDSQKKKRKKAAGGGDAGGEERKMRARSLAYEKRRGQTQITDDTDSFYDPSRTARAYAVRVDSIQSSVTSVYLCRRVYGLQFTVYGLRFTVYGLQFRVYRR